MVADFDAVAVETSNRVSVVARFCGPTNSTGARVRVARGDDGKLARFYGWDYSLNAHENYAEAVRLWLVEREWGGRWFLGSASRGYVAVWGGFVEVGASVEGADVAVVAV